MLSDEDKKITPEQALVAAQKSLHALIRHVRAQPPPRDEAYRFLRTAVGPRRYPAIVDIIEREDERDPPA